MINETILYLVHTGFGGTRLEKFEQELHGSDGIWDPELRVGKPLRKIFSKVVQYDYGKKYAELGVLRTNSELIQVVHSERPKYLLWPSMMYEIQELTFQAVRREGSFVIGWFFDDECRFDDYSRWWIPYLDYVLTCDQESVKKYQELGATAVHTLVTSDPDVFQRLNEQKIYEVSFVGSRFVADRENLVDRLVASGVQVHTFGKGWSNGYISNNEMIDVYNASKINLCFTKSYGTSTRPQFKNKIFDICMCGGFLLCEYIPGIEEYFEIDKEIVCFKNIEEGINKIQYYLSRETEREKIAEAGWTRAQRDYSQSKWLSKVFETIEKDTQSKDQRIIHNSVQLDMPQHIRRLPAAYHLHWAEVLIREGYDRSRCQEEIDLVLFYDPDNVRAKILDAIIRMPLFIRLRLARLLRIERFMIYRLKSFFRKYGPFIIGQRYYGKWFFEAAYEDNVKSHSPIAEIIAEKIKPSKVLDFGCGDGTLLHELKKRGVTGIGYEYSKYGTKLCHAKNVDVIKFDFSKKQFPSFENNVDMVISIEVAEHLPEKIADYYCEVLSKCSDAKVLFFSAAVVGQTGEGHLNEQPLAYWKEKFVQNGWRKNEALTEEISEIMKNKGVSCYYWENLQIFQRS